MPRLDGPDAWAQVRAQADGTPFERSVEGIKVIGVSGHSGPREVRRFTDAGVHETMSKPVEPDKLRSMVAKAIRGR